MGKKQFRLRFESEAIIELDDAVTAVVDDEWRDQFYNLQGTADIAEHIGYNLVIRRCPLRAWTDGLISLMTMLLSFKLLIGTSSAWKKEGLHQNENFFDTCTDNHTYTRMWVFGYRACNSLSE